MAKYTSVGGQMYNGRNSKESFQYFKEYYALKEEIREVLSFQYYCTVYIKKNIQRSLLWENHEKDCTHG